MQGESGSQLAYNNILATHFLLLPTHHSLLPIFIQE